VLKDFKTFVLRGNVVDLAIGVMIGVAFGAVVTGIVADILTPFITIPGKVNFASLSFTIGHSKFLYGAFINTLIAFILLALVLFFFVVRPINSLNARRNRGENTDPSTRDCPECLSVIPIAAHRCAFCTSEVPTVSAPEGVATH
jgi:large conductance mechanosensitive channel